MNEATTFKCPHCFKATEKLLNSIDDTVQRYQHASAMHCKCTECGRLFSYAMERIIVFHTSKNIVCDTCDEEFIPKKPLTNINADKICDMCMDEYKEEE